MAARVYSPLTYGVDGAGQGLPGKAETLYAMGAVAAIAVGSGKGRRTDRRPCASVIASNESDTFRLRG